MLEDITGANPRVDTVTLRSLLGCFMFTGDDVFKTLGVLSGGERNRYALARMLVSPANFLLLDEPTNHLDMRAKDVLLDAIREFTGTVLFVSHDRYFIDGLATRVFEVEERRVHIYPGNYEDYLFRKNGGLLANADEMTAQLRTDSSTGARIDAATGMLKPVKQVGKTGSVSKEQVEPAALNLSSRAEATRRDGVERPAASADGDKAETLVISSEDFDAEPWESTHEIVGSLAPVTPAPKPTKRLNPIKLKQMEDRVLAIEDEIADLDARIAQAEQQQVVYTTAEAARALAAELETLREQHAVRTAEWEELAAQLEEQTNFA
jgi:ATP-binding cassette subfamily F protein 3